jgi:hypothetical protein
MAVSIITLKTGDNIITNLKQVYEGEREDKKDIERYLVSSCLIMEEPYILNLDINTPQYLTEAHGMEYQVRFSKWNPYSPDRMFKIPYDCVMTISNPEPGLQKAYQSKITQKQEIENDRTTTVEN